MCGGCAVTASWSWDQDCHDKKCMWVKASQWKWTRKYSYAHWTWTCTTLMSQGISPSSAMSPRSRLRHCFNVIVLSVMNWTIPNPQGSNMIPSRTRHDVWSLLLLTFCVYICYIYKKGWLIGCLIAGLFLRWVHIHDLRITDQWFGIDYWTHALLVSSNWGSK